ncbi:hypothetical protein PoB_002150600 [Plakobranchus ocellatus]|uniref:Uncharacterized protein n=1 Tax=Plakobranchus ocellatus TaxID=259542 RepID=A0AAV3Z6R0_9GAST|nr:hypothetical protein PoB_002150600 [Plakobranchus ocellatus]
MRRGKLEHLVTTGKFEGKRSRGRQREKIMDGLATWLGPGKVSDILAAVKDRDLWRDMIAKHLMMLMIIKEFTLYRIIITIRFTDFFYKLIRINIFIYNTFSIIINII